MGLKALLFQHHIQDEDSPSCYCHLEINPPKKLIIIKRSRAYPVLLVFLLELTVKYVYKVYKPKSKSNRNFPGVLLFT